MHIAIYFVITLVIAGVLFLAYLKVTNQMYRYWEFIRYFKRRDVIPHMDSIRRINNSLTETNSIIYNNETAKGFKNKVKCGVVRNKAKVTGAIDRQKYKQPFDVHKKAFIEYLDFCNRKQLSLSPEEELFSGFIDETEDLLYPEQALDRKLKQTNDAYDEMYALMSNSGEQLLNVRTASAETIDRVTDFINSIAKHPKEFDVDISEITINRESFKKALEYGKEEQKKLKQSAVGAGSGVAAGAAVASMGPTAAMWVATTFGTASTGTAISALSGAAATNAALAWLGGGALAAGGGGMAAGQALLALAGPVGWGIAGASVLTSALLFWRKKKKIQESKKQEIERMINCTNALKQLKAQMDELYIKTEEHNQKLFTQLGSIEMLYAQDYTTFTEDQKEELGSIVNNTKSLADLISKVLS